MRDTYLPAFESWKGFKNSIFVFQSPFFVVILVVWCVHIMKSMEFHLVPNKELLNGLARKMWGFEVWLWSHFWYLWKLTITPQMAKQVGVQAGCDLDCGNMYQTHLRDAFWSLKFEEEDEESGKKSEMVDCRLWDEIVSDIYHLTIYHLLSLTYRWWWDPTLPSHQMMKRELLIL